MKAIFFSGLLMDPNYLNSSVSSGERRIIIKNHTWRMKYHSEGKTENTGARLTHTEFPGIMWNIKKTDHWTK